MVAAVVAAVPCLSLQLQLQLQLLGGAPARLSLSLQLRLRAPVPQRAFPLCLYLREMTLVVVGIRLHDHAPCHSATAVVWVNAFHNVPHRLIAQLGNHFLPMPWHIKGSIVAETELH